MIELAMTVSMRRSVLETMLTHARTTPARECCGALLGWAQPPARRVERAAPLSNQALHARDAYLIDAPTVRRIERDAHAAGLAVVGFYHSHPDGPAIPSVADLDRAWPWFTYVIVGNAPEHDVTAWRLRADRSAFDPEELEWVE